MFTVNDENEARALITLACPRGLNGKHIAPELALEQTLDNLNAFGDRLADLYVRFIQK